MTKLGHLLSIAVLALGASAEGDQPVLTAEIGRQNNQSLLWGPYKPNLYFGVRPRLPEGLWTGLMWGGINNYQEIPQSRLGHCHLDSDIR